LILNKKENNI